MHTSPKAKRALLSLAIAGFSCLPTYALAQVFQAEDYTDAYDTDPGNHGGAYRNGAVDIQATTDTGGGYNVGWIAKDEWLVFNNFVVPKAGEYTISLRVSSPSGASAAVELDGGKTMLGVFDIPATGDWQRWTTVTRTARLPAGTHRLGVFANTGGWNINWISVTPLADGNNTGNWWRPTANTSWHWQLRGTLKTNVDATVYDIDLFDTKAETIASLQAAGRKVVCYFSAGSSEDWRDDYPRFKAAEKGNQLDGYPDERWLDIRSANVRSIMIDRLNLAKAKGCDGVEPDNVDGYTDDNDSGFPLTAQNQADYNIFLANQAHARGLAVGLKNDTDQLKLLEPHFDFAVNEQCSEYGRECEGYSVFTSKNKPVFNAEYKSSYRKNTNGARDKLCAKARAANMRTLVLSEDLDGSYRYSCD